MATEDLIAALQGAGRVDSEGSFSFDREKAREKLLVMVTNRGTRVVIAPHVAANFYGGSTKLESRSAYAQTSVLRPGEPCTRLR